MVVSRQMSFYRRMYVTAVAERLMESKQVLLLHFVRQLLLSGEDAEGTAPTELAKECEERRNATGEKLAKFIEQEENKAGLEKRLPGVKDAEASIKMCIQLGIDY